MTTYAQHITRVTGLPREVTDSIYGNQLPAVDVDGDVHTWSFPGTAAEAEAVAVRKRDQLAQDKTAPAGDWKLVDQVVRILAEFIETGSHDQVEVDRTPGDAKVGIGAAELAVLRLVDLQDHAQREEKHRQEGDRLNAQKFLMIHKARAAGCSWGEIGKALGMSKQAAQDYYVRRLD